VEGGLVGPLSFRPGVKGGAVVPIAGVVIILCEGCAADVEACVDSYGESGEERQYRFWSILQKLRTGH
jgi:hypothetical protein